MDPIVEYAISQNQWLYSTAAQVFVALTAIGGVFAVYALGVVNAGIQGYHKLIINSEIFMVTGMAQVCSNVSSPSVTMKAINKQYDRIEELGESGKGFYSVQEQQQFVLWIHRLENRLARRYALFGAAIVGVAIALGKSLHFLALLGMSRGSMLGHDTSAAITMMILWGVVILCVSVFIIWLIWDM